MVRQRETVLGIALSSMLLTGCGTSGEIDRSQDTNRELYYELSSVQSRGLACSKWPEDETPSLITEELITSIAEEVNNRDVTDRKKILKPWLHFTGYKMPTDFKEIMDTLCQPGDGKDPMTWTDDKVWYSLAAIVSRGCQGFDPMEDTPYDWSDIADRINETPFPARKDLLGNKKPVSSDFTEFMSTRNC